MSISLQKLFLAGIEANFYDEDNDVQNKFLCISYLGRFSFPYCRDDRLSFWCGVEKTGARLNQQNLIAFSPQDQARGAAFPLDSTPTTDAAYPPPFPPFYETSPGFTERC